jgi:hypothetical protein
MRYVRFGSKADISRRSIDVRFTPESRHVRCNSVCPLSANSGHRAFAKKAAHKEVNRAEAPALQAALKRMSVGADLDQPLV